MQLPELTTLTGTRSVASHSDEGVSYELDLDARTCTCRNFVDGRAQRDPSSIGRLCKHLGEVAALDPALQTDTLLTALVQRNYGAAHFYRTSLPNGAVVAIGYTPGGEWVDVFARDRVEGDRRGTGSGPYERFGFNRRERRWSYGEGPPGATVLRELLRKLPT